MNNRLVIGLVLVAAVLAAWNQPVPQAGAQPALPPGITAADRTVAPLDILVDEKVHVTIDVEGEPGGGSSLGVDVFFVVDRSNTMFAKNYIDSTTKALTAFVQAMDFSKSSAGLISYAETDSVGSNLTKDQDAILQAINTIRHSQETDVKALQGAFRKATQKLDNDGDPANQKYVIVVAAGQDANQDLINMPTVTQAARNAGVNVIFLMFPDSRYQHFVDAASDCSLPICPRWQGPRGAAVQKWAWGVDPGNFLGIMNNTLAPAILFSPRITAISVYEAMNSGAAFVSTSSVPPPSRPSFPPYVDIYWDYPGLPPAGIHIEYDAQMVYKDETYPVTDISEARVDYSSGIRSIITLPNPLVTVRDPASITPTVTPPPSPTLSPTPVTPTPVTPTATPTDTPTPPSGGEIYLPILVKNHEL